MQISNFSALEKKLGLVFPSRERLMQVFIHRSYLNEHSEPEIASNERLEFLGDAVLELVVTEYLYHKYPDKAEGDLTAIRSSLVKREHLALVAKNLQLGDYLIFSRGEEQSGGNKKDYILANTIEALLGAIFLTFGYKDAERVITDHILPYEAAIVETKSFIDAKSKLQEIAQEKLAITPHYELLREQGPDHNKIFVVVVCFKDDKIAEGQGSSKRKAEEKAAHASLEQLGWM